jgi:hypothetical protein
MITIIIYYLIFLLETDSLIKYNYKRFRFRVDVPSIDVTNKIKIFFSLLRDVGLTKNLGVIHKNLERT